MTQFLIMVNIPRDEVEGDIYMLFTGREGQDQGHSFFPIRTDLAR